MVKYFCDVCETEVTKREYIVKRYRPSLGKVECEIMVRIDGIWNSGCICLKCLKEVLNKGREKKE